MQGKIQLLTNLQALGHEGIEGAGGDATRGSGAKWQRRGIEIGSSLVLLDWTVEQAVSDYKARRPIQNPAPLSQYIFSRDTPLRKAAGCEGIRAVFRRPRWRLET